MDWKVERMTNIKCSKKCKQLCTTHDLNRLSYFTQLPIPKQRWIGLSSVWFGATFAIIGYGVTELIQSFIRGEYSFLQAALSIIVFILFNYGFGYLLTQVTPFD